MHISRISNISSLLLNNTQLKSSNILLNKSDDSDSFVKTNSSAQNVSFGGMTAYEKMFLLQLYCGNTQEVKKMLKNPYLDINAKDETGQTALHFVAFKGYVDVLKELLKREDINVNSKNNDGLTALHYAVNNGHTNIVAELIQHKDIDINAKSKKGNTALYYAAIRGEIETAKILLQHKKIDINAKNESGDTALDVLKQMQLRLDDKSEKYKNNIELIRLLKRKREQSSDEANALNVKAKKRNERRLPRFTIRRY